MNAKPLPAVPYQQRRRQTNVASFDRLQPQLELQILLVALVEMPARPSTGDV